MRYEAMKSECYNYIVFHVNHTMGVCVSSQYMPLSIDGLGRKNLLIYANYVQRTLLSYVPVDEPESSAEIL